METVSLEFAKLKDGRGVWVQDGHVLEISGKDRDRFLHNLLTQNVQDQAAGERRWSALLTNKGHVIGFFQVWKLADRSLLIVHESQKSPVFETLQKYWITEDLQFKWLDDVKVVSTFVASKEKLLEGYPYQTNKIVEENILRCAVDDLILPSVQMLITEEQLRTVSGNAAEISKNLYESIRIQSGFPLPIVDYEDPLPLEIPFMHRAVSFTKGCYVGQETMARLHSRGGNVSKKLLQFIAPQAVSAGDAVTSEGEDVGKVTSVATDFDGKQIGLAWIHRKAFDKPVQVQGKDIKLGQMGTGPPPICPQNR